MELTTATIRELIKMVVDNRIDKLKVGELEITKVRHETVKPTDNKPASSEEVLNEDELLFWSTSSPSLTSKQVEELAYSSVPVQSTKPKRSRRIKDQS